MGTALLYLWLMFSCWLSTGSAIEHYASRHYYRGSFYALCAAWLFLIIVKDIFVGP